MSKTTLRLALFNCDGTLVDSAYTIYRSLVKVFRNFSYDEPSLDEVKAIIGLSPDQAIARLLKRSVDDEVLKITTFYKENLPQATSDIRSDEPIYVGILEVLASLEKNDNVLLGVVTGRTRFEFDRICAAYKLNCFITTKTSDDCPSKPDPTMIWESCKRTGVFPENTYVISDTIYDMQMAKLANAKAIGVCWGYHTPEALTEAGADFIARTPDDLIKLLDPSAHA